MGLLGGTIMFSRLLWWCLSSGGIESSGFLLSLAGGTNMFFGFFWCFSQEETLSSQLLCVSVGGTIVLLGFLGGFIDWLVYNHG